MKPDRVPGPSRGAFCDCGWETPVVPASMSALDVAEHRVHHLEWQHDQPFDGTRRSTLDLLDAYRAVVGEHEAFESRQRARIVDLEVELEATRWDLKVAGELVDDLKADLAACEADLAACEEGRS